MVDLRRGRCQRKTMDQARGQGQESSRRDKQVVDMSYYPSKRVIDKLFGLNAPTLFDEPLNQKENYGRILGLALNNKGKDVGSIGFHGPFPNRLGGRPSDSNESLLDIAKEHGLVLLTKLSGDFPSDHIIVVPMDVENGEPQDFWILEMEEETYDGRP